MRPESEKAMNKSNLTKAVSKHLDLPIRKAEEIVDRLFETVSKALVDGDRIEIRGFGSFTIREYEGYTARNPRTGEKTVVGPKKLPFFRPGKALAERLNNRK